MGHLPGTKHEADDGPQLKVPWYTKSQPPGKSKQAPKMTGVASRQNLQASASITHSGTANPFRATTTIADMRMEGTALPANQHMLLASTQ